MTDVPAHILAQVHVLAARGERIERIAFLLRLSPRVVEAELKNPTAFPATVNTTEGAASSSE